MTAVTQISALVSPVTKGRLECYAQAHGMKKGYLIESALLHHIAALEALPAEVVIPPRLTVSAAVGEQILQHINANSPPTAKLAALLALDKA